jgi:hypothetical protein
MVTAKRLKGKARGVASNRWLFYEAQLVTQITWRVGKEVPL